MTTNRRQWLINWAIILTPQVAFLWAFVYGPRS